MGWSSVCKLLQKQSIDFLSHRYGTLVLVLGCMLIISSAFLFGEAALEWSTEKYAAVFNSFSDNLSGKSYRNRLCLPVPIDIVYTWVNGTDPKLLAELRKYKSNAETEVNITTQSNGEGECRFSHCIPSNIVVLDPALPKEITADRLGILYPPFKAATSLFQQTNPLSEKNNVTLAIFNTREEVQAALKANVMLEGNNVSVGQVYYTSEWTLPNGVMTKDTIVMSGFPHTLTENELFEKIPEKARKVIDKFHLNTDKSVAYMIIPKREEFESLLQNHNITIEGKEPQLNSASLVWDLTDYSHNEDVSESRFEDNEELRYSLRSVEQYAPWVRHIYIVTNGQIPGWLNLDNPRLTIVTHEELFKNKSHLPSFSSPAIESHLHEIPGLSDKFLYLNDDVMFGKDVWPDDFFNHAHGQKVYLTWPIPNCQDGCPSTWIRDGYCDKACNNSECEWDGGDCAGGASSNAVAAGPAGGWQHSVDTTAYCNSGCANNWIADRYCDQSCNVHECGFDAGDCGVRDFHRMTDLSVTADQALYQFPPGERVGYLNISALMPGEATVEDAGHNEESIVRAVAVAQKFKVIAFVLFDAHNSTQLNFTVKIKANDIEKQYNFTVTVNTNFKKPNKTNETNKEETDKDTAETGPKTNDTKKESDEVENDFILPDIPKHLLLPNAKKLSDDNSLPAIGNLSDYQLPDDISKNLAHLLKQLRLGDLTKKGFDKQHAHLWAVYQNYLNENHLKPVKVTPAPSAPERGKEPAEEVHNPAVRAGQNASFNSYLLKKQVRKESNVSIEGEGGGHLQKPIRIDLGDLDGVKNRLQKSLQAQNGNFVPGQVDLQRNNTTKKYDIPSHKTRKLNAAVDLEYLVNSNVEEAGFLPWEKQYLFSDIRKKRETVEQMKQYETAPQYGRVLLDTFGDSLRHVNRIYNKAFGYVARKVPAHMPHMIDKNIMAELQAMFPAEWAQTSANRIRASSDMQFAFSYFYYLMGVPKNITTGEVFDDMDKDQSGVLSDRELRTLATRLYELPLDLQTLTSMEATLINCSKHLPADPYRGKYMEEKYYDKDMPQVTKHLVLQCGPFVEQIHKSFKGNTKYKFELASEDEVAFKMIRTNVSQVVGQLDDIRKTPKKFICLNDNIDHKHKEAKTVKAVIVDFYEALFPNPSSFELPREYRNRFLHVKELRDWRKYRDWLKWWTQLALFFLVMFTIASFFSDKIEAMQKNVLGRRTQSSDREETRKRNLVLDV